MQQNASTTLLHLRKGKILTYAAAAAAVRPHGPTYREARSELTYVMYAD